MIVNGSSGSPSEPSPASQQSDAGLPVFRLTVPLGDIVINWLKAAALGSALWPLLFLFTDDVTFEPELFQVYIWAFALSFFVSVVLSLLALLVFLAAGLIMNRMNLQFRIYCLVQNTIHIGAAILTFTIIHYRGITEDEFPYTATGLGSVYTICGLFIWNSMYYRLYKKQLKNA